ncbi:MAG: uroporphyrinogen decarboxylase family protein, partial [Anaerolineae bacterium]
MVEEMTGRERVLTALAHREPDRIPIDFGSTWITTITISAYERLKEHLGLESETILMERMQQVCMVDERILEIFDVDTRGVFYGPPELECNQWVELSDGRYRDAWGITWQKPSTSYYYDMVKPALGGEITFSDVINHPWPDPHDPGYTRGLRDRVKKQRESTDCALVLNLSVWFVQCSQFIRGFEDWFVDMVAQPRVMETLFDVLVDIMLATIGDVLAEVGDLVDVVSVSDDVGTQDRTVVSPEMYRRLIKPRQAKAFAYIHERTEAPLMYHTCGSVYDIMGDLIEIGVDALNPVQTTAAKMEPERLKGEFGDRISFWGGIDSHRVLPWGTKEEVKEAVCRIIHTLGPGGGYILNSVHN